MKQMLCLKKWYLIPIIVLVICLLIVTILNLPPRAKRMLGIPLPSPEVNYQHADWLYNPSDPESFPYIAALQDYVFVGQVVSDPVPVHLGTKDNYDVYTEYKVRVLMNIRGTLVTNMDIPVLKEGGYDDRYNCYTLFEYDSLPQKGEICVIAASNMTDGSYRLATSGFTTFTAIGISSNLTKNETVNLSNGIVIDQTDVQNSILKEQNPVEEKNISLKSVDYIEAVSDIENGLTVSEQLLQQPDSPAIRSVLGQSTLVKLWLAAVSEENAVESRRERIMDSPYGVPGSPSYTENIDPYPLPPDYPVPIE